MHEFHIPAVAVCVTRYEPGGQFFHQKARLAGRSASNLAGRSTGIVHIHLLKTACRPVGPWLISKMNPFTAKVIDGLRAVPPGRVTSYGRMAAFCGNPRAARQVARILHSSSQKYNLPWHRVVNAVGEITSPSAEEQKRRLVDEGQQVDGRRLINPNWWP